MCPRDGDELARIPSLRTYFRTRSAIILHLTNGTLQINFFEDHSKVILCPLMGAVTYINEKRKHRTFRFDLIKEHGCSEELGTRLKYVLEKVETMINSSKVTGSSRPAGGVTSQAP